MTIHAEARGEPLAGQIAVGEVIRNRAKRHVASIAAVVLKPNQFSCWSTRDPNRLVAATMDDDQLAVSAWDVSLQSNTVQGSTLYYATSISPPAWVSSPAVHFIAQIGAHRFYTED